MIVDETRSFVVAAGSAAAARSHVFERLNDRRQPLYGPAEVTELPEGRWQVVVKPQQASHERRAVSHGG